MSDCPKCGADMEGVLILEAQNKLMREALKEIEVDDCASCFAAKTATECFKKIKDIECIEKKK